MTLPSPPPLASHALPLHTSLMPLKLHYYTHLPSFTIHLLFTLSLYTCLHFTIHHLLLASHTLPLYNCYLPLTLTLYTCLYYTTPVLTCLSPPLFHCNTKQLTALETMHEIFISIHKKEHKHTRDVNTRQKSQNLLGSSLRRVLETFHWKMHKKKAFIHVYLHSLLWSIMQFEVFHANNNNKQ